MNKTGWFFLDGGALSGSYVKKDFNFKAKHIRIKTDNTVTFSFNGKEDHGKVIAADGYVEFRDANKSDIFVKGTGTVTIQSWDGA